MEIDFYWVEDDEPDVPIPKTRAEGIHLPSPSFSRYNSPKKRNSSNRNNLNPNSPLASPSKPISYGRTNSNTSNMSTISSSSGNNDKNSTLNVSPMSSRSVSGGDDGLHIGAGARVPRSVSKPIVARRRTLSNFFFSSKSATPDPQSNEASNTPEPPLRQLPQQSEFTAMTSPIPASVPRPRSLDPQFNTYQPVMSPPRPLHTIVQQQQAVAMLSSSLRRAALRRPSTGMLLKGLGLVLSFNEAYGVCYISDVAPQSVAASTELIFVNDVIVEIEGTFVLDLSLDKIIMTLATAGKEVHLVVTTMKNACKTMSTITEQIPQVQDPFAESPRRHSIYSGQFWTDSPERLPQMSALTPTVRSRVSSLSNEELPSSSSSPSSSPTPSSYSNVNVTLSDTSNITTTSSSSSSSPTKSTVSHHTTEDTHSNDLIHNTPDDNHTAVANSNTNTNTIEPEDGGDGTDVNRTPTSDLSSEGMNLPSSTTTPTPTPLATITPSSTSRSLNLDHDQERHASNDPSANTSGMNLPTRSNNNAPTPSTSTTNNSTDDSSTTTSASGKEYGFFVKPPPKRKSRKDADSTSLSSSQESVQRVKSRTFIARMFSPNVEPQPLQAIAIAAAKKALADSHDGDELIDERSIPRDLCSMRSASITTSINPPLTSRPAGLLTAEDARVGRKHDAPRLSLAEEVSLAMDDGSSKVKSFLQSIGLEHLEELFITQEIDFETIPSLTEEDLEKIGITKLGVRKKIMRGVRQLSNGFGSRSPPSSETSYRTDSMSIVMKESSRGTRSGSRSIMSAMSIDVSEQSAFSVVQRSRSSSIMD